MNGTPWAEEFGLDQRRPPYFLRNAREVDGLSTALAHAHVLRRAFSDLRVDGIVYFDDAPAVYFRELPGPDPNLIWTFHRSVWNEGLASLLVILLPDSIRIYSALVEPAERPDDTDAQPRLVEVLQRVRDAARLRSLALSVETGDYFRRFPNSFDPARRVDHRLLENLTAARRSLLESSPRLAEETVDALLCRVLFSCYLVDRRVIGPAYFGSAGARNTTSLRHLLENYPGAEARRYLYEFFKLLKRDFNGDLFHADLTAECEQVSSGHVEVLRRFLHGDDLPSGQVSLGFWAYDFAVIPIETISAIYERFLRSSDQDAQRKAGAFYTPRLLAVTALKLAIGDQDLSPSGRYLDPACGSGIFLVTLFHRLAEQWRRANPEASYDEVATGLVSILRDALVGVDKNPIACRVAALSLYVALLDRLAPPDITELQKRGHFLPPLVWSRVGEARPLGQNSAATIIEGDFGDLPEGDEWRFDLILGNPPWVSREGETDGDEAGAIDAPPQAADPLLGWCAKRMLPVPQGQLACAFIWKASAHLRGGGRACMLLPCSLLFNHDPRGIEFQHRWLRLHGLEVVLNLSDLRFLLFEGAKRPCVAVRWTAAPPAGPDHPIRFYAPKADMRMLGADLLSIVPADFRVSTLDEVLSGGGRRPGRTGEEVYETPMTIWKELTWSSFRDRKFLDRLGTFPQLQDYVEQITKPRNRRWVMGEGYQPLGEADLRRQESRASRQKQPPKTYPGWEPGTPFVDAKSPDIDLVLVPRETRPVDAAHCHRLRRRPDDRLFDPPHVLFSQGMKSAYSDFRVVFRHALRGIHGPDKDRAALRFLAVYLGSNLAKYYWFQTAANFGTERPKVHVTEALTTPFVLPEDHDDPREARAIIDEVAEILGSCAREVEALRLGHRRDVLDRHRTKLSELVYTYFGVDGDEAVLIEDALRVSAPSAMPTRRTAHSRPALRPVTTDDLESYKATFLGTIRGRMPVAAQLSAEASVLTEAGLSVLAVRRTRPGAAGPTGNISDELGRALAAATESLAEDSRLSLQNLFLFTAEAILITKPLARRHWTKSAALNDADEVTSYMLARARGPRS